MAAVEVTITGMLYDKLARTTQNVVLIGEASLTGLGVGGGPIIPDPKPPRPPVGVWPGPGDPDFPGGGKPPGIWGPGDPRPQPPIELPPDKPPPIDPGTPPVSWKPVWTPSTGWIVVGVINPDIPHPVPST